MLPRQMATRKSTSHEELPDAVVEDDLVDIDDVDDVDELVDEDDALGIEDVLDDEILVGATPDEAILIPEPAVALERNTDDSEDDDDEDPDDEDVEASLDVILKERLVVEDEPVDDEVLDSDDRSDTSERVLPKQPDEFVCRSCFLVKHPSQLADKKRMLCRDCV